MFLPALHIWLAVFYKVIQVSMASRSRIWIKPEITHIGTFLLLQVQQASLEELQRDTTKRKSNKWTAMVKNVPRYNTCFSVPLPMFCIFTNRFSDLKKYGFIYCMKMLC